MKVCMTGRGCLHYTAAAATVAARPAAKSTAARPGCPEFIAPLLTSLACAAGGTSCCDAASPALLLPLLPVPAGAAGTGACAAAAASCSEPQKMASPCCSPVCTAIKLTLVPPALLTLVLALLLSATSRRHRPARPPGSDTR